MIQYGERSSGKVLEYLSSIQEYLKSIPNLYALYMSKDTLKKYGKLIKESIPYNVKVITVDEEYLPHNFIMLIKEGEQDD